MTNEVVDLLRFRRIDGRNGFASGDETTVRWLTEVANEIERRDRIVQAAMAFVDAVGTELRAGIVAKQAPDEWLELSDAVICAREQG